MALPDWVKQVWLNIGTEDRPVMRPYLRARLEMQVVLDGFDEGHIDDVVRVMRRALVNHITPEGQIAFFENLSDGRERCGQD